MMKQAVVLEPRDFDLDIACGGGIEEALDAAMALGPASRAGACFDADQKMRRCRPDKVSQANRLPLMLANAAQCH